MSTHKYIDKICVVITVCGVILALILLGIKSSSDQHTGMVLGYEERLFSTDKVHTIDIVIDDWEGFLSTAQSEEYSLCSVVIDGESVKHVGIRGKGNTSLSSVASMDSDRYSFKIEFDQYDSTQNYYGLDKLCLNNLIQDNTYMKDYLTYQMMDQFGVDAPLCSYAYVTVNGEDWGLYLAVEAVEEAFLQRNYGAEYGELYKPDSMSMGGGFGGGREMESPGEMPEGMPEMPEGMEDFQGEEPEGMPQLPEGMKDFQGEEPGEMPEMPEGMKDFQGEEPEGMPQLPEGMEDFQGEEPEGMPQLPEGMEDFQEKIMDFQDGNFGGGMGSSDVKLQYIDDDPESYSNIFQNAKTDVTEKDQKRLISSLKQLSAYENLDEILDVDEVLRYFVVHNFVVNGDSYTGSMIHNYYLYEEEGRLSMIPWDYNLAFGTFQGGSASSSVNDAIDEVLTDRPMQAWIFSEEEYQQKYYELYEEMLEQIDISGIISNAYELISPYVEKDPTAFCTYEEFQTGVETLQKFCTLRAESVQLQLAGSTETVDTGQLNLSDMGTMNQGRQDLGKDKKILDYETSEQNPHQDVQEENAEKGDVEKQKGKRNKEFPTEGERNFEDFKDDFSKIPGREEKQNGNQILIELGISFGVLALGLLIAYKMKRYR